MKFTSCLATAAMIILSRSTCLEAQDRLDGSPLEDVIQEMKVAGDQLAKKVTDKPTQKPQNDAIEKLDLLITKLEKERDRLGNGFGTNPTQPATSSTIRNGPGGMGELYGARTQGDHWAELPAHERDRILQSLTEGFPPHYQAVLEAYYKRLAVEKRAEEPEMNSAPETEDKKANVKPAAAPSMKQSAADMPAKTMTSVKKASK